MKLMTRLTAMISRSSLTPIPSLNFAVLSPTTFNNHTVNRSNFLISLQTTTIMRTFNRKSCYISNQVQKHYIRKWRIVNFIVHPLQHDLKSKIVRKSFFPVLSNLLWEKLHNSIHLNCTYCLKTVLCKVAEIL